MAETRAEETRATARLPNLDIEIVHSRSPSGQAERLSISVLAVPSFEAFNRYVEAANPFLFWMRAAETAWAPWLEAWRPLLPLGKEERRLPLAAGSALPRSSNPGQSET
ncbi:MAG TPA: hypothetical protein VFG05_06105 [Methylocella sp.]|nr:hypothetical protein [Methylocella sp.]